MGYGSLFTYCTDVLQALGGRCLHPDRRGAGLSAFSRHPGRPRLGRFVPHFDPDAQPAPHAGEPPGRTRPGPRPQPARDRGPGCGIGAATGCALLGPEAPGATAPAPTPLSATAPARPMEVKPTSCHGSRIGVSDERSGGAIGIAPPDRGDDRARALPCPVHDRQGEPRQAAARSGPSPSRDPGWRSRRDLRPRDRPASRKGRKEEAGRGDETASTSRHPSRDG